MRDSSSVLVSVEQLLVLDALWDRVTIHVDGRGQVAVWSGETTPIKYFRFRLTAGEVSRVRRWVVEAAALHRVRLPVGIPTGHPFMYFIRAGHYAVRVVEADLPTPLRELTHTVDVLIDRYA